MRKIKILTIGSLKNKSLKTEVQDLIKRLPKVQIIELKEVKDKNIEIVKKKEFEILSKHIDKSNQNILLWEFGEEFNTKEFNSKLKQIDKDICFIITGAYGPADDLKNIVKHRISLSKMTFTHEQALYMLIEQLYRVQCFEKNIPYTK